jgi:hypothetical protein
MHWRDFREKALFGLVDGLNGAVGLTIGLLRAHAAAALIFVALLARAGSSSVSMAGAQYESDDSAPSGAVRWGRVAAMGLGYLTSALLPGLGFAFSRQLGIAVFVPVTIVTWTRAGREGWLRAAATTLIIFVLAVAAGLAASFAG